LLLEAVGTCASVDVVLILDKMRTPVARLEVSLEGTRHSPEPRYYSSVRARFDVWGEGLSADKVERAIYLSFARYCSVYHSLRPDLQLHAQYRVHATGAEAAGDYLPVEMSTPTTELN
jgi:putative redox protein